MSSYFWSLLGYEPEPEQRSVNPIIPSPNVLIMARNNLRCIHDRPCGRIPKPTDFELVRGRMRLRKNVNFNY